MDTKTAFVVRKSNRCKWFTVGMAKEAKEKVRHAYLTQRDYPGWQIGMIEVPDDGKYPEDFRDGHEVKPVPLITPEIARATENLVNHGITPINPPIVGALTVFGFFQEYAEKVG
jgi:hypothetical protein